MILVITTTKKPANHLSGCAGDVSRFGTAPREPPLGSCIIIVPPSGERAVAADAIEFLQISVDPPITSG
jgi:hypothetical protein